jgi:hypothetical protein
VNAQIEGVSEKEIRLQERQWAIEDQINELQKQTYDAETISNQLKDFVANFPGLDQGERKLLVESLVEGVEIGKNKRVAACLRPPFAFGFFSPDLAPRVGKPQVPELRIGVEYDLGVYYRPSVPVGTVTHTEAFGARYSLAPKPAAGSPAHTPEGHALGRGRSKKRGATVFNLCS